MRTGCKEHRQTQLNDLYGSITYYNSKGPTDFSDDGSAADEDFEALIAAAGERVGQLLVDLSARSGYSLSGARPLTPEQQLSEYYDVRSMVPRHSQTLNYFLRITTLSTLKHRSSHPGLPVL